MPDAETAIRAFNGLRRELPLLLALAANSPFRHGRDTGLASAREVSLREWPRSGVPRAMRNFADFREVSGLLTRAADVPDYTYFWWKLRPHPRLGTVEIRALDAQTSLSDTAALVALVHCLARDAADLRPGLDPPPELIEEGIFRAARFGVDAQLPDAHGTLRPVSEILEHTLARVENRAHELGCVEELALLPELLQRGGGASTQRAIHKIAGIDVLVQQLTQLTAAEATTRRPRPAPTPAPKPGRHRGDHFERDTPAARALDLPKGADPDRAKQGDRDTRAGDARGEHEAGLPCLRGLAASPRLARESR
jgi:glutamate---cysteine ligase / carboxylate-amine ligase